MSYWFWYCFFQLLSVLYFPRTVIGLENIPQNGNFLVASNHISNVDPFIVGVSCRKRFAYIAKEELFENPIVGHILRSLDAFPIKRNSSDLGALRTTLKKLKEGRSVVLFPEGTRRREGQEQKIQSGIGFLAVKTRLPVVPVYLDGSDKVLPPGAKFFRRHKVTVRIGKPFDIDHTQDYLTISTKIMENVRALKQA